MDLLLPMPRATMGLAYNHNVCASLLTRHGTDDFLGCEQRQGSLGTT